VKFIRFMARPARPVEAKILSFAGFLLVVIAGMVMARSPLPTVVIATGVALGIRLAGTLVTQPEADSIDVEDERRAA
jgi:hypothetical protein